jgi:hypothetical protein
MSSLSSQVEDDRNDYPRINERIWQWARKLMLIGKRGLSRRGDVTQSSDAYMVTRSTIKRCTSIRGASNTVACVDRSKGSSDTKKPALSTGLILLASEEKIRRHSDRGTEDAADENADDVVDGGHGSLLWLRNTTMSRWLSQWENWIMSTSLTKQKSIRATI